MALYTVCELENHSHAQSGVPTSPTKHSYLAAYTPHHLVMLALEPDITQQNNQTSSQVYVVDTCTQQRGCMYFVYTQCVPVDVYNYSDDCLFSLSLPFARFDFVLKDGTHIKGNGYRSLLQSLSSLLLQLHQILLKLAKDRSSFFFIPVDHISNLTAYCRALQVCTHIYMSTVFCTYMFVYC